MGTITRRMESAIDEMENIIQYSKEDFENAISEVRNADEYSRSDKTVKLCNMFIAVGFNDCKYDQSIEYYIDFFEKNISNNPFYNQSVEAMVLRELFERFESYPTPKEYMKTIVDNNAFDSDISWRDDSLRLRILKQFIKYTDYLKDTPKMSASKTFIRKYVGDMINKERNAVTVDEVLENIDDSIFDYIDTPEAKKKANSDKLLKTADNLAEGKFRTSGRTQTELYYFAMAYDMNYYTGAKNEVFEKKRDIEKNLFQDYYCNNIMRVLSEEYQKNTKAYEAVPSERGINYKNYAEMVYLYFVNKDCTPLEKVQGAEKMIKKLQELSEENDSSEVLLEDKERGGDTKYYRGYFKADENYFTEDVINYSETDFFEFVLNNYNCKSENKAPTQKNIEQETAFSIYDGLKKMILKYNLGINENEKPWKIDSELILKAMDELRIEIHPDDEERYKDFVLLANKTLEMIDDPKFFQIESSDKMSRTALIVVYYYLYCSKYSDILLSGMTTFKEVYDSVSYDINAELIECGYQEMNGRNIFDVFVLLLIYIYSEV